MAYKIGEKTWFKGNEITITSDPYDLYGTTRQDGKTTEGKKVTILTPEAKAKQIQEKKNEWNKQQAEFHKLHK